MARDDFGFVRQVEQASMDGVDDLLVISARKVGATDASGEEGVASQHHFERSEVETDGSLGMARRMEDLCRVIFEADAAVVGEGFVGGRGFGCLDAKPGCLLGHHLKERQISFVQIDGSAGEGFKLECSANVVNVGMGDEDLIELDPEGVEAAVDAGDLIARVDDDGFACFFVGEDCAVALERADRKRFENHEAILGRLGVSLKRVRAGAMACPQQWSESALFLRGSGLMGGLISQDRAGVSAASIKDRQGERGDHEDHGCPGGESSEDVGSGARTECGLGTLPTEGACEIGGTALLDEYDSNQEDAHQDVENDNEVEENLHY